MLGSKKKYVTGILLPLMLACSPTLQPSSDKDYYEDLTVLRPVYSIPAKEDIPQDQSSSDSLEENGPVLVEPQFDITYQLDSLLDSIAMNNQKIKYLLGYTIQVYTGNSQEEANEAKTTVYKILPQARPQVTYDLPNYKVKVGKYYYRLEAQKEFAVIKKEFPSAILVPQQFEIE